MKNVTKKKFLINNFYGFIVILANITGIMVSSLVSANGFSNEYLGEWVRFMDDHRTAVVFPQYLTFVIPAVLCTTYSCSKKESHFINVPIMYATFGTTGWLTYALEELCMIFIALKLGYNLNVSYILGSSYLSILMDSLTTFALSYFIMETIHRKFVLPKFYPDGRLTKIQGVKQPALGLLFIANYFSVTLFPV